jgi:glutamate-ammonia-ligase adenylyltransferase
MVLATNPNTEDAVAVLPPQLREPVTRQLQKIAELDAPPVVAPEHIATMVRMLACSEYAAAVFLREANWLFDQGDALSQPPCRENLREFAQEIACSTESTEIVQSKIRRFRNRYFLHILWREYSATATLNETLHAISDLADGLLQGAADFAHRQAQRRFGVIRDENDDVVEIVILGMGKLGGRELNFSSDIDVIFLYPGGSDSDGDRSLSPHEYFARVSRTIIALLDAPTADGFAFRVDTRLRPFGDSGPPVTSFAALESYLLQHGRSWERYAYIKAKTVGPLPPPAVTADLYDNMISPFVYRRYLDYGVFESLREMHALIATEVQRRELADDVKLGPGGIREIEFIVQSLQLVRGGSQPELRSRELQTVLPRLAGHRDIAAKDVDELLGAYAFLRRTENFIQAIRDQQTHKLPADEADRMRLALAMGCVDWESFRDQLDEHRDIVGRHFEKVAFREHAGDENSELADRLRAMWKNSQGAADWIGPLREEGYAEPEELAEVIAGFRKAASHVDVAASQRLEQFVPQLFALVRHAEQPGVTLRRTLSVIEKVLRRSAYIALLNENSAALGKLVDLCTRSAYVARQIAQYPVLLDELLNPDVYTASISRASMTAELEERGAGLFDDDSEQQMEMLAKFQRSAQFRIAIADFNESLPIMRVSDCLTELAETVLEYALKIAWRDMTAKYGKPADAGFAIVAYGKFGGLELSYGSDLDLVFLHDSTVANAMTDGPKPLDHTMFFTRLVRRLVFFLTTQTASGVLYEVDTRLRPDGKSGLLVTSTDAFARYQEENAWTWEHQALLRARAVVGRPSIAERFKQIRQATLTAGLHKETLRNDVISMRQRMRKKLDSSDEQYFDLKQGVGGIGDIEFLVQYLVLAHAAQYPSVIEFTDNIRQLDALAENNILTADKARCLQDAYRDYRHRAHHLLLDGKSTRIRQDEFSEQRKIVTAAWHEHL